jgi:GTP-binding nuclear protein Ran
MFDLMGRETLKSVSKWERDLRKICPEIPIVLIGNKCDGADIKIKSEQIKKYLGDKMHYVEISCKTCF